ncbi:MAG: sulfite exporter TauE/SafE family protein [Paracoccaceae bacterium]
MVLDLHFFMFAVPAVLFAGLSKGGFGSGAAFAAAPFLALAIDPKLAVGLMLPLLMLMDVAGLRAFWRGWNWPVARALMVGMLPGVAIGALVFRQTNPDILRLLIGGIAIAFVAFQLARARGWLKVTPRGVSPGRGMFWGLVAGFTSFVSHAGGPPATVYLLSQNLSKRAFQSTTVLAFWWVNLIKVPPYIAIGLFTPQTLLANLYLAPVAVVGVLCGVWLHNRTSDRVFFGLAYAFLVLTGLKLIYDGLT